MADNEIKGGMMRGHIDTIILLSLVDGDKDSNDIRDAIEEKSDNKYSVKQGTFYSAMQRLVKQNYIKEYRSSAVDGIRRKYYSLTAKGKSSLDKNREEWNKSKELIDNLIETPSEQPKVQENKPTTIADEFDAFKQFADKNASDFEFSSPDTSDDYIDKLGEEVLNDLNDELNSLAEENAEIPEFEQSNYDKADEAEKDEKTEEPEISEETTEITEDLTTDATDEIPSEYDNFDEFKEDSYSYDFELPEEEPEEPTEEIVEATSEETEIIPENEEVYPEQETLDQPENTVEEMPAEVTETIEEERVYESGNIAKFSENTGETTIIPNEETYKVVEEVKPEITEDKNDDMLYVEEGKPTNSRDYKTLLGRLFPKDEEKKPESAYAEKQLNFDDYEKADETEEPEEETYYCEADDDNEKIVIREKTDDKYDYLAEEKTPRVERTSNGDYDFSDLYALANKEGFKVRTSFSTNKNSDGSILINKLNFHAALLLYAILFVEMAVLNFSLSGLLGWSNTAKAIIASSLALYTAVTLVMYAISPRRKVKEITSFKDTIEVSLIIVFQLVIIILCVALFCEVDFNNVKEVLSFIVLPFILCINLPLFPILKYSLLGSGKYFDK